MKNAFIAYVICILCLSGCTNANKEAQVAASAERLIPRQEDGTLAYEHHFIIWSNTWIIINHDGGIC